MQVALISQNAGLYWRSTPMQGISPRRLCYAFLGNRIIAYAFRAALASKPLGKRSDSTIILLASGLSMTPSYPVFCNAMAGTLGIWPLANDSQGSSCNAMNARRQ